MQNKTQREVGELCHFCPKLFLSGTVATKNLCLDIKGAAALPLEHNTRPGCSRCSPKLRGSYRQCPQHGVCSAGMGAVHGQHGRQRCERAGSTALLPWGCPAAIPALPPETPRRSSPCSFSPSHSDIPINCERFIVQTLLTVIFFLLTKSRSSL